MKDLVHCPGTEKEGANGTWSVYSMLGTLTFDKVLCFPAHSFFLYNEEI